MARVQFSVHSIGENPCNVPAGEASLETLRGWLSTAESQWTHPPRGDITQWALKRFKIDLRPGQAMVTPTKLMNQLSNYKSVLFVARDSLARMELDDNTAAVIQQSMKSIFRYMAFAYMNLLSLSLMTHGNQDAPYADLVSKDVLSLDVERPIDREASQGQRIRSFIDSRAAAQNLRRTRDGRIMEPKYHAGKMTATFVDHASMEDFITHSVSRQFCEKIHNEFWDKNHLHSILKYYMSNDDNPYLPWYEPDYHLKSFANGVLDIASREEDGTVCMKFDTHENIILEGRTASWFHPGIFDPAWIQCEDFLSDIPDTTISRILETQQLTGTPEQWEEAEGADYCPYCRDLYSKYERVRRGVEHDVAMGYEAEWAHPMRECTERHQAVITLLASIARLYFELDELDDGQFVLFILGKAGCGKSLMVRLIQNMFLPGEVGLLQSKSEENFPLAPLHGKRAWVCPEVKRRFNVDPGMFQSIITGDAVNIYKKGKDAQEIYKWTSHGFMVGNEVMNIDDCQGSIRRRFLMLKFNHVPDVIDEMMASRIRAEMPAIIAKCVWAYHIRLHEARQPDPDKGTPLGFKVAMETQYFVNTGTEFMENLNPMYEFFSNRTRTLDIDPGNPELYMPCSLLIRKFNSFMATQKAGRRFSADIDKLCSVAREFGIKMVDKDMIWPPNSNQKTPGVWFVGVAESAMARAAHTATAASTTS